MKKTPSSSPTAGSPRCNPAVDIRAARTKRAFTPWRCPAVFLACLLAVAGMFLLPQRAGAALTDNLELYYSFDNDTSALGGVHDNSANIRNGTGQLGAGPYLGGTNALTTLIFDTNVPPAIGAGNCLSSTNSTDYINCVNASGNYLGVLGGGSRTVALWMKHNTNAAVTGHSTFAEWGDVNTTGGKFTIKIHTTAGAGNACLRVEVKNGQVLGSTQITNGNWFHIAATYDSADAALGVSGVKLYVNGKRETLNDFGSTNIPVNTLSVTNVVIGVAQGPTRHFNGWIDEFGIWSRALSATEITNLFTGTVVPAPAVASTVRVETAADGSGATYNGGVIPSGTVLTNYAIYRDSGGAFLSNGVASWSLIEKTSGILDGNLVPAGDQMSAVFTAAASGTCKIHAAAAGFSSVDSGTLIVHRDIVWKGDGGGNVWDLQTTSNWWLTNLSTTVTFADGDNAVLDNNGAANNTVSLSGDLAPESVGFGGTASYTLTGSGRITGVASLSNYTSGVTTILTSNNYAGVTWITGGTLKIGTGGTLGTIGNAPVLLQNSSTLALNRSDAITILNQISGQTNGFFGNLEIRSGTVTLSGNGNNANLYAHVFNGATLILNRTAIAVDGGNIDSTPALVVDAGGLVKLNQNNANIDRSSLLINGTFDLAGYAENINGLTGSGVVDNTSSVSNSTLTVGQNAASSTFTGVIRNTGTNLALTKTGLGTMSLSNVLNSYSGDTTISAGTLQVLASGCIPDGTGKGNLVVNNGGTFDLYGFNETVNGLTSASNQTTGVIGNSGGLSTVAPSTLTLGAANVSATYDGTLTDNSGGSGSPILSLTKIGTGTQVLTGPCNHYGATTVSNGVLRINGTLSYSPVTVASGGTLGGTGTLSSAVQILSNGTLSPGASIGTLTISSNLTLAGGSFTSVEVDQTSLTNDLVAGLSNVVYGGTLVVTNLSGTLVLGNSFTLFSSAAFAGNFSGITPPLGGGLAWSFNPTNGVLSVVSDVVPASTNASLTSLALTPAGTLSPTFGSNVFNYTATEAYGNSPTVTVVNADLTATNRLIYNGTTNLLASGVASGPLTLVLGVTNVVTVRVTAQDGVTVNTYTVGVTMLPSQTQPTISKSVVGNQLTLTWPGDHLGWYAQSNSVSLVDSNSWFNVPNSQTATNLGITINPAQPKVFYRLHN